MQSRIERTCQTSGSLINSMFAPLLRQISSRNYFDYEAERPQG
jgi:hypothetical protein